MKASDTVNSIYGSVNASLFGGWIRFPLKPVLIICCLVLCSIVSIYAEEEHIIAVSEVVGDELSESQRRLIQDIIISEIGRVEYLTTVERSRLVAILEEQEMQLSGLTREDQAVTYGRLLNATLVIVTAINRAGLGYDLSARIVDVESGRIVTTERTMIASESDLPNATEFLARQLTNRVTRVLEVDQRAVHEDIQDLPGSPYYREASEILSNYRWEEGQYSRIRNLSYGLTLGYREALYQVFEKTNAPTAIALNVLPLGLGSIVVDRNYLPFSFQSVGALFGFLGVAGGDAAYAISGGLVFLGGYVMGFIEPGRDQTKYNDRLQRALHLDEQRR